MEDLTTRAEEFEAQRPRLTALAYRMLGSRAEAQDAVQEAWLRLSGADPDDVGAWLTTVTARVCVDMLRARRSRREDLVGTALPEPLVSLDDRPGPEQESLLADSVGLALLVVLDTLAPPERLAFVLHDMFGVPFEEIGAAVGRSPAAARQLASRARRRVRGAGAVSDTDVATQRRVVEAFLAATRAGDFAALLAVLDPDAVMRIDGGGREGLPREVLVGATAVARQALDAGRGFAPFCVVGLVHGGAGMVVRTPEGRIRGVAGFTVVRGRITALDLVLDPAKLPD